MSLIEEALRKRKISAATPGRPSAPATSIAAAAASTVQARRNFGDPGRTLRLNIDALREAGLLAPNGESRAIESQFRALKRPLIQKLFAHATADGSELEPRCSVMITSALPGDGKTFTSMNLALSMAMERDHSVILVDGDVAKPHISRSLGLGSEAGLLDLIDRDSTDIESVLVPTDLPGLSVLPVGRQSHQATEMLASEGMRNVIGALEGLDSRAIVLVDSPPILVTSEARVLASLFDQVVMVVRAGGTPKQAVLDAIKMVGEGPEINLVLNQALHAGTGAYYGYGGRYAYGEEKQGEDNS
jgi:exopolysaccharide/PEP-CTERM locus tyrosine autokinase